MLGDCLMPVKPAPILLTWKMPDELWVTTFEPTGGSKVNPYDWKKKYALPSAILMSRDYDPNVLHMISSTRVSSEIDGWSCEGQYKWRDTPIGTRNNLLQAMIRRHLKGKDIPNVSSKEWIIEGPEMIDGEDGSQVEAFVCIKFQYTEVDGGDALIVDLKRKVQSSRSIWEEHKEGVFVFSDLTREVRVKVAIASDPNAKSSKWFRKKTDYTLNDPFKSSSNKSMADYWRENGHPYTDQEAGSIIQVEMADRTRYPADKVYRVMTMDQWDEAIHDHLKPYLKLKPSRYLKLLTTGMRWMTGWKLEDYSTGSSWDLGGSLNASWFKEWNVLHSDSRELLRIPSTGQRFLDDRFRWDSHLKRFNQYHKDGLPEVEIHYITPSDLVRHIPLLMQHSEEIYSRIPGWASRVTNVRSHIIPDSTQAEADDFVHRFISEYTSTEASVVVFSALPPKGTKKKVDLYKCLRYNLDEAGIVHQNFKAISPTRLATKADYASGLVNVMQMLLKHGILPVPFTCEIGEIDVVSALDVGREGANKSVTAFAVSITGEGRLWGTAPRAEPQRGENISESALRRMVSKLRRQIEEVLQSESSRVLIIRDGNTPVEEKEIVEEIIEEYRSLGMDICWISLRKSGVPRLLNFEGKKVQDELPVKGQWMKTGEGSAWIWSTGAPMRSIPGIPQGIGFDIEFNFASDPLSIEDASRLLIAHAHASQMTPWSSTRLPFVHHLADKMAKAMINGEIPLDQNGKRFSAA